MTSTGSQRNHHNDPMAEMLYELDNWAPSDSMLEYSVDLPQGVEFWRRIRGWYDRNSAGIGELAELRRKVDKIPDLIELVRIGKEQSRRLDDDDALARFRSVEKLLLAAAVLEES